MDNACLVWILSMQKEGLLVDDAIDTKTGERRCFVFVEGDNRYICDEDDLEYVEDFYEYLKKFADNRTDS